MPVVWRGLIALNVALLSGCAMLHEWGVPGLEIYVKDPHVATAVEMRDQFQQDRDPQAFNWLLSHRIATGMTLSELNHTLGETGERIYDDEQYKANIGEYLQTDVGYKWGPDRNGRSVILFFREGRLVNFTPDDFAAN